ncbi:MAG TPA: hypothetical protein VL181_01655 [Holophagaceae bacterium]|nr:hypothetical protein [Holophagaceae bacterium]
MTKKKLVLNTETLRLLSERDAQGVHGGSVTVSVTASKHSCLQESGCPGKTDGCHLTAYTCPL